VVANANGFTVSGRLSGESVRPIAAKSRRRPIKLGTKAFRVAANHRITLRLRMPGALGRLLQRKGRLTVRVRAKLLDPAGHLRTVTKLLSPRLKHKRTALRRAGSGTGA
jgi:hypothetical protein